MLKFVTYSGRGLKKAHHVGLQMTADSILPLAHFPNLKSKNMLEFITKHGLEGIARIKEHLWSNPPQAGDMINSSKYQLQAPIPLPHRNIICIGKNYLDHVSEVKFAATSEAPGGGGCVAADIPNSPIFFTKAPQCVIGPDADIESHPGLTRHLDWEVELAVIIGKQGRDIKKADALAHVFGYTIANDVTARDLQKRHNQWFKGKTLDSTCPMGPYIVPACCLTASDAANLELCLSVNGEQKQLGNTKDLIFDVPTIISTLSEGFTLLPGDIILTGTPSGVGFARKPSEQLKRGDKLALSITHLGELRNQVV